MPGRRGQPRPRSLYPRVSAAPRPQSTVAEATHAFERMSLHSSELSEIPETFHFEENVINLVTQIREVDNDFKELFLFELLLNADDALTRFRKKSLIDKKKYKDAHSLEIHLITDWNNRTLSIVDNGIGMTRHDLLSIFNSDMWLERHLDTLKKYLAYDIAKRNHIYKTDRSKWGLGFFSAYMVADKVVVTTRVQGDDVFVWEYNANDNGVSTFSVAAAAVPGDASFVHGTKVTLHIKPGHYAYLKRSKLQELVSKCEKLYHLNPILLFLNGKKDSGVLLNDKKEVPIEILKLRNEDIRLMFVKYISERATNVDVVISDRATSAFFCILDLYEDNRKPVLEINPRCHEMKVIRRMLESVKKYSKDRVEAGVPIKKNKKTTVKLHLTQKFKKEAECKIMKLCVAHKLKEEAALKCEILQHFHMAVNRFAYYDTLNDTSFYEKAVEDIRLLHRWRLQLPPSQD